MTARLTIRRTFRQKTYGWRGCSGTLHIDIGSLSLVCNLCSGSVCLEFERWPPDITLEKHLAPDLQPHYQPQQEIMPTEARRRWVIEDTTEVGIVEPATCLNPLAGQDSLRYPLQILLKLVIGIEAKAPFLLTQRMVWQDPSHGFTEDIFGLLPFDFQMPWNAERKTHQIAIQKRHSYLQAVGHRCPVLIHQEIVHQLRVELGP